MQSIAKGIKQYMIKGYSFKLFRNYVVRCKSAWHFVPSYFFTEVFLSLHKIQIPMNLFVFIAIYILPSMLLAGIFAPKLGKLIQRLIEYLLNKISK